MTRFVLPLLAAFMLVGVVGCSTNPNTSSMSDSNSMSQTNTGRSDTEANTTTTTSGCVPCAAKAAEAQNK